MQNARSDSDRRCRSQFGHSLRIVCHRRGERGMRDDRKTFEWTADAVATLRQCWAEELVPADIGRMLGVTRSAVRGKAHRLGLPARTAQPGYVVTRASTPARPKRPPVPKLAEMQGRHRLGDGRSPTTSPVTDKFEAVPAKLGPPAPAARPTLTPPATMARAFEPAPVSRRQTSCCWPIGQPGQPGFRFCGHSPMAAKPYCEDHSALAYLARPRSRSTADRAEEIARTVLGTSLVGRQDNER